MQAQAGRHLYWAWGCLGMKLQAEASHHVRQLWRHLGEALVKVQVGRAFRGLRGREKSVSQFNGEIWHHPVPSEHRRRKLLCLASASVSRESAFPDFTLRLVDLIPLPPGDPQTAASMLELQVCWFVCRFVKSIILSPTAFLSLTQCLLVFKARGNGGLLPTHVPQTGKPVVGPDPSLLWRDPPTGHGLFFVVIGNSCSAGLQVVLRECCFVLSCDCGVFIGGCEPRVCLLHRLDPVLRALYAQHFLKCGSDTQKACLPSLRAEGTHGQFECTH